VDICQGSVLTARRHPSILAGGRVLQGPWSLSVVVQENFVEPVAERAQAVADHRIVFDRLAPVMKEAAENGDGTFELVE
jgi:hypothetical protein